MSLQGLGCDKDIPEALEYFETAAASDDAQALNGLGVIYFSAPSVFETDPAKLHGFGKIRKDVTKATKYFEQAAAK